MNVFGNLATTIQHIARTLSTKGTRVYYRDTKIDPDRLANEIQSTAGVKIGWSKTYSQSNITLMYNEWSEPIGIASPGERVHNGYVFYNDGDLE